SLPAARGERLERLARTFGDELHRAVRRVAYPARHAERSRLVAREEAIADALHVAADLQVHALHGDLAKLAAPGPRHPPIGSTVPSASSVKVPVPVSCAKGAPRIVNEMRVSEASVTVIVPDWECHESFEPPPGLSW